MSRPRILASILFILSLFLIVTASHPFLTADGVGPDDRRAKSASREEETPPPSRLRLAVVGDLMMHDSEIRAGRQPWGNYDYRSFFREVKPWFARADLVVGNLETTLPGSGRPYSGYPLFRSPDAFGEALSDAGFDLLSTANNHAMDAGEQGVLRTHRKLREMGIQPVGTSPGPSPQKPVLVEKHGIRLSFSSYTYGTNGIPLPAGKEYLVNPLRLSRIRQDIRQSRERGAEFVIVMLHFGQEYQREPDARQKRIVREVLESGADAVLGGHPHVLQPMERVRQGGRERFVIYSLGNFVSDQLKPYTNDGLILYLDLVKKEQGETRLEEVSYVPTYVHKYRERGTRQFRVLPVRREDGQILAPSFPALKKATLERVWKDTTRLMDRYGDFPVFTPVQNESEQ